MTRLPNDVLGVYEEGEKIRISLPRLLDSFESNLTLQVSYTLNVILLHELSHWADGKDFGDDVEHAESWNRVLYSVAE